MMKDNLHTKVDLENGSPAFAKPVLYAVIILFFVRWNKIYSLIISQLRQIVNNFYTFIVIVLLFVLHLYNKTNK